MQKEMKGKSEIIVNLKASKASGEMWFDIKDAVEASIDGADIVNDFNNIECRVDKAGDVYPVSNTKNLRGLAGRYDIVTIKIILCVDDAMDLRHLIPVFYFYNKYSVFKHKFELLFDYSNILNDSSQTHKENDNCYSLAHKLEQFLWFFMPGNKNFKITNNHDKFKANPVNIKDEIKMDRVFPLIEINEQSYMKLFKQALDEFITEDYFSENVYKYNAGILMENPQDEDGIKPVLTELANKIRENEHLNNVALLKSISDELLAAPHLEILNEVINEACENKSMDNDFGKISSFINEESRRIENSMLSHFKKRFYRLKSRHVGFVEGRGKKDIRQIERLYIITSIFNILTKGKIRVLPLYPVSSETPIIENIIIRTGLNNLFINREELKNNEKALKESTENGKKAIDNVRKLQKRLYEILHNQSLMNFMLFTFFCKNTYIAEKISKAKLSEELSDEKFKELLDDLTCYFELSKRYASGIKEIAENILFHTHEKTGYLYIRLYDWKKSKDSYKALLEEESINRHVSFLEKEKSINKFFEIFIADFSRKGIVDSFSGNYRDSFKASAKGISFEDNEKLNKLQLEHFFSEEFGSFPSCSVPSFRTMAQMGLKYFAILVKESYGYFDIESNCGSSKKKLVANSIAYESNNTPPTIGKSYDMDRFIDGTYYRILLPMDTILMEKNEDYFYIESHPDLESIGWLLDNADFEPIELPRIHARDYQNPDEKWSTSRDLAQSFKCTVNKHIDAKKRVFYSLDYKLVDLDDIGVFISTLAELQLNYKSSCIVVYNMQSQQVGRFKDFFKLYFLSRNKKIWNENVWLYLYDESGVPFVLNRETAAECDEYNAGLCSKYGKEYHPIARLESSDENTCASKNKMENYPFELILQTDHMFSRVTIFEKLVLSILEEDILSNEFGVRLKNAHISMRNKAHIDNYYKVDLILNNNYYVIRIAYLIAKDIKSRYRGNKIFLIGYKDHSELLIIYLKELLKDIVHEESYIFKDKDDFIRKEIKELEYSDIALVIPVSTMTTTVDKVLGIISKRYGFAQDNKFEDRIIYNCVAIVVRDKLMDPEMGCTENEKSYMWEEISLQDRIVKTKYKYAKNINFLFCVEGRWQIPHTCCKCFPDDVTKEKLLLETKKNNTSPGTVFEMSWFIDRDILEKGYEFEKELPKVDRLVFALKYGHVLRLNNHSMYYIHTTDYYNKEIQISKRESNTNDTNLLNWMRDVKNKINNTNKEYVDFIVTHAHNTNMSFITLSNNEIFNGKAQIIRIDVFDEHRNNIINDYKYLSILKNKKTSQNNWRFHFINDMLVTGKTYLAAKNIINSIFYSDENIEFFSIISLINSLSLHEKRDFVNGSKSNNPIFYSYLDLFLPSMKSVGGCFLCERKNEYGTLMEKSSTVALKAFFYNKKIKLEEKGDDKAEDATVYRAGLYKNRSAEQLKHIHSLNYRFSILYENSFKNCHTVDEKELEIEKELDKYEADVVCGDIANYIDFIKALCTPFLSQYHIIKKICLKKLLLKLDELLNKREPVLLDYNLLLVLMKQLVILKSNFIIRKESIKSIWEFYSRYVHKYSDIFSEMMNLREHIEENLLKDCLSAFVEYTLSENPDKEYIRRFKYLRWMISAGLPQNTEPEKIKTKIFSLQNKKNYKNLLQLLKKYILKYKIELKESYVDNIAESIYNITNFNIIYSAFIKHLLNEDMGKSYWFEYLLRNGYEIDNNFNEAQSYLVNSFDYNIWNEIEQNSSVNGSDLVKPLIKSFAKTVHIENTSIHQRALSDMLKKITNSESPFCTVRDKHDKACWNCNIPKILDSIGNEEIDNVDFNTVFKELNTLVSEEYYFKYLRYFINKKYNSNMELYIDRDSDLEKLFLVVYAKIFIKYLNCKKTKNPFTGPEEIMGRITAIISRIMQAKHAFFSVKGSLHKDESMYIIGRYEILEDTFQLNEYYYTNNSALVKMDNNPLNKTYIINEEKWDGEEKGVISFREDFRDDNITVIRFTAPIDSDNSNHKSITMGCITLIGHEGHAVNNIRYVLLLEDEIKKYLHDNFQNNNFSVWAEAKKMKNFYARRNVKFRHGAEKDIEKLLSGIEDISQAFDNIIQEVQLTEKSRNVLGKAVKSQHLLRYNAWKVESEVHLGLMFSNSITEKQNMESHAVPSAGYLESNKYPLMSFLKGLKFPEIFDSYSCTAQSQNSTIDVEIDSSKEIYTRIRKDYVRRIIVELVLNFEKRNPVADPKIMLYTHSNRLVMKTFGVEVKDNDIDKIRSTIKSDIYSTGSSGIGLYTINRFFERIIGESIQVDGSGKEFTISLPMDRRG